MSREKHELVKALEDRRRELARLINREDEGNPLNDDAYKDESRIKDEIAELTRKLKIIEKQGAKGS